MPARRQLLSPVLLLGAGRGEATCGILYLAGYLRRHGVEAFVRLDDRDETDEAVMESLTGLLSTVKPKLVGISMKWFNHMSRGLLLARMIRQIDPDIRVVVGGNSASYYWKELAQFDELDDVILGDGEQPLLGLVRGMAGVPNVVSRGARGQPSRAPLGYVETPATKDVYYSHFDHIFLSGLDKAAYSGWVAPGKGCGENCVYCGGGRGLQQASFGRADSFLRAVESVHKDHREVSPFTWQLRYDFSGGNADFLRGAWKGVDLSKHSTTYFLWGVPPRSLVDALAETFQRVYMVLDIGCFSELQRHELISRGLLKPCPTNNELFETVAACRAHRNVKLEVCGIDGLPFTSQRARDEEAALVERLLSANCDVGSQRLESQPGALVTQHADRFEMVSDATDFETFVSWFEARGHATDGDYPMVRFGDPKVEKAVQRASDRLRQMREKHAASKVTKVTSTTTWLSALVSEQETTVGEWLGAHRVSGHVAKAPVTLLRALDGRGVACAPSVSEDALNDPNVQPGESASALLAAIRAFAKPTTQNAAVAVLKKQLGEHDARDVVEHLAESGFIAPV